MNAVLQMQTEFRRDIHKYPEDAWTEFRTTSKIIDRLNEFGVPLLYGREVHTKGKRYGVPPGEKLEACMQRAVDEGADPELIEKMRGGYTGAVGILDTGRPGPVTAVRFDIDCIDAVESDNPDHLPAKLGFRSVHDGLFHGCGHDAHAAIGIGTAAILSKCLDQLRGKVLLVFQPGEEGLRGASSMAESGLFDSVDNIFAGHVCPGTSGLVVTGSCAFSVSEKFDLHYRGAAAHAGGSPELGKNALLAAATAALNIMAISRTSRGYTRVNVGTLNAGTGRNVIPSFADMECEVRGENQDSCDFMAKRLLEIAKSAGDMHGCGFSYEVVGKASGARCDRELDEITEKAALMTDGVMRVEKASDRGSGSSEDFTTLMHKVQEHGGHATFFLASAGSRFPNHSDRFDVDEKMLNVASRLVCNMIGMTNKK
ncbi:MAG: amidohydrolase [Oscillospiraceae bacterium]